MADRISQKQAIVNAVFELVKKRPLDDVSVTEICRRAGVSRQTFYRCFKDKYDAVMWYIGCVTSSSCARIGLDWGWRGGYVRFLRSVEDNAWAHAAVLGSRDYNSVFYASMRDAKYQLLENYVTVTGEQPSELIRFQTSMFSQIATIAVEQWVAGGCKPGADEFADMIVTLVPAELFHALDVPAAQEDGAAALWFTPPLQGPINTA